MKSIITWISACVGVFTLTGTAAADNGAGQAKLEIYNGANVRESKCVGSMSFVAR